MLLIGEFAYKKPNNYMSRKFEGINELGFWGTIGAMIFIILIILFSFGLSNARNEKVPSCEEAGCPSVIW